MTRRQQLRRAGAIRLSTAALAVLLGLMLGIWVVELYGEQANLRMRIDQVERRVGPLVTAAQSKFGSVSAASAARFSAHCPEAWQVVGAIAGGLWGCRAPAPAAKSFHPNCNVTRSWVAAGTEPEHYFKSAVTGSPQLKAAKSLGGHSIVVHGRAAYQASFDHRLLGPPMRVLATVFVEGEQAYALTCTAPVPNYSAYAAQFREIAGSFELTS